MNFIKTGISFLLLLTYSLGFAHNLVPHCSSILPHESHAYSHQHHSHQSPHEEDHMHVVHQNHVDDGLLDYVLCVVNDTGNEEHECVEDHFFTIQNNAISLKKIIYLPTSIILFAINNELKEALMATRFMLENNITYVSPPLKNTSLRGPPIS